MRAIRCGAPGRRPVAHRVPRPPLRPRPQGQRPRATPLSHHASICRWCCNQHNLRLHNLPPHPQHRLGSPPAPHRPLQASSTAILIQAATWAGPRLLTHGRGHHFCVHQFLCQTALGDACRPVFRLAHQMAAHARFHNRCNCLPAHKLNVLLSLGQPRPNVQLGCGPRVCRRGRHAPIALVKGTLLARL